MTIISSFHGSGDAYAQLVEGLKMEFGCADIGALADRIFEAEKADFHWESRVEQHYLGQQLPAEIDDEFGSQELARVAILSRVAGRWHRASAWSMAMEMQPISCGWAASKVVRMRSRFSSGALNNSSRMSGAAHAASLPFIVRSVQESDARFIPESWQRCSPSISTKGKSL